VCPNRKYADADDIPSKKQRVEVKIEEDSDEAEIMSPGKDASQAVGELEPGEISKSVKNLSLRELEPGEIRKSGKNQSQVVGKTIKLAMSNSPVSYRMIKPKSAVIPAKGLIQNESNVGQNETTPSQSNSFVSKVSSDKSKLKTNSKKVMASDEEVAQWVKEYETECLAKANVVRPTGMVFVKNNAASAPSAGSKTVPSALSSLPYSGTPRRFVTKLSQCMNEDGDDAHYVISKINFAMTFVQSQDRKIKELNDRYVELTRENDQLREEHSSLRAHVASAKLNLQAETVACTQAGMMGANTGGALASPVTVIASAACSTTLTVGTSIPTTVFTGAPWANQAGGLVYVTLKDPIRLNSFNVSNVSGGDAVDTSDAFTVPEPIVTFPLNYE